jgi:hypothetical protein
MRKLLLRVTFVAACLVTIGAVLCVVDFFRTRAMWRAYQTEAAQRGLALQLADYLPAVPPDEENFASIPLFEKLFANAGNPQSPGAESFALPEGKPPKLSDHSIAQRIDLVAWQRFFDGAGLASTNGGAGEDRTAAAELLRSLDRYAAPIAELRRAATRPVTRFPVKWDDGWSALLPHLAVLKNAATINALWIEAHLAQRDSKAAYEDFRFGLRLAAALEKEPVLLSGLVRIAMLQTLGNAVWSGLAIEAWDDSSARQIADDLAPLALLKEWHFAMNSERAAMNTMFDQLVKGTGKERAKVLAGTLGAGGANGTLWGLIPTSWLRRNQLWLNRYTDQALAQLDPTDERFRAVESRHSPESLRSSFFLGRYYALAIVAAPAYDRIEQRYLATHTFLRQIQTACALERFRRKHGEYPQTMDALVPDFIEAVPRDVMDGQPLRYRRVADGRFILYSIGQNGKDDGGVLPDKPDEALDWAWQYSR